MSVKHQLSHSLHRSAYGPAKSFGTGIKGNHIFIRLDAISTIIPCNSGLTLVLYKIKNMEFGRVPESELNNINFTLPKEPAFNK